MRYLNVGCGGRYSKAGEWINIDLQSGVEHVIGCDVRKGIPFGNENFDLVYHSHVLEHFSKEESGFIISECIRVLRPGGVLRISVPDLEQITRQYLILLDEVSKHPNDRVITANYDWILLEMYDQVVRNCSGGEMGRFLSQAELINKEFIMQRCGAEMKRFLKMYRETEKIQSNPRERPFINKMLRTIYHFFRDSHLRRSMLLEFLLSKNEFLAYRIGQFRRQGEIHQWMYDRYSLKRLLEEYHLKDVVLRKANESYVQNWEKYNLDTEPDGSVYKADSIFVEAVK